METKDKKQSEGKNEGLLKGMFLKTWMVVSIGMFLTMINSVVDGVIIGRFLGSDCIAALGLTMPVVLLGNLAGTLLGQGTPLLCAKYVGMADRRKLCEVFSTSCIFALLFSLPLVTLCYAFTPQIAGLCSGHHEIYAPLAADYLYGFWPLLGLTSFLIMLNGLMRLDNDFKRGPASALVLTIANAILDLACVALHGGMLGMSLASTGSACLALLVLLAHFRRENILLRFSFHFWHPAHLLGVLKLGFANTVATISIIVRTFFLNWLLLSTAVSGAVAAFGILQSLSGLFSLLVISVTASVSMIAGMLHGEGDRRGLESLLKISLGIGTRLSLCLMALILLLAEPLASMYVVGAEEEVLALAARSLRFFALFLPLFMLCSSMSGYYLSLGRTKENYLLVFFAGCLFPILSAWLLYPVFGLDGVWSCFAVGALGADLLIPALAWLHRNRRTPGISNVLLLDENFGARPEDIYETTIRSLDDVVRSAEEAQNFCRDKKSEPNTAQSIALCIEEMAKNVIAYGFQPGGRNHLEIRLISTEGGWILRLRDDCRPFDPVKWLELNHSKDPLANLGIRMVMKMAKDIHYLPVMGLNQLIIKI